MMTLPPPVTRSDRAGASFAEDDAAFSERKLPREPLNAPAIIMAVVIALLLFAMVWWFVRQL